MDTDNELILQLKYLGQQDLIPYIYCVPESSIITFDNQPSDKILNIIDFCKTKNLLPVLNLSTNPIPIQKILDFISRHHDTKNFFILNCDARPEKSQDANVGEWPHALLMQQMANQSYKNTFTKIYRIGSLMRQVRLHRLMLLEKIKPYVTDQDVIVANSPVEDNVPTNVTQSTHAMTIVETLPWTNNNEFLDIDKMPTHLFGYVSIDHPAYKARVNITNESWFDDDLVFITEKTWKAYACGCLVINFGSSLVPKQLAQWGISIWEDYDKCVPYLEKINHIVELFQRNDIDILYQKNIEQINHNQQLCTNKQFATQLCDNTIKKIKSLTKFS